MSYRLVLVFYVLGNCKIIRTTACFKTYVATTPTKDLRLVENSSSQSGRHHPQKGGSYQGGGDNTKGEVGSAEEINCNAKK